MRGEEVVDDARAILLRHVAYSGYPRERYGTDELTKHQVGVEVVKFVASFAALQEGVERLAVLVDDVGAEGAGGAVVVGAVTGCASKSA